MDIPKGTNTGLAMQFLASDVGREWKKTKDYEEIYEALGVFTASLNTYEIPQP